MVLLNAVINGKPFFFKHISHKNLGEFGKCAHDSCCVFNYLNVSVC